MLRSGSSSSRVFSPLHEESGDEDLCVLPRHTKVIVTGNNRTKSVLVGLKGVVKNAVGHGGWHWLVLEDGSEVKLQRNALSVLEPPPGNEEDDYEMDYVGSGADVQEKASLQLSSNDQDGKQISPTVKRTKPSTPASAKSAKSAKMTKLKLNFSRLSTRSLLKYWRRYNPGKCSPNITKNQLVHAVQKHFYTQTVDEEKAIVEFIRAAKRLKSGGS